MKVLKNNFNNETTNLKPYQRKHICNNCESELEYEESDLKMGEYGCMYLTCPLCKYSNMIEDNEKSITLTVDNIEFPIHFHHVATSTGAVDCCNTEMVREHLHKAINYFRKHKDEYDYGHWITGNFYFHVHRYEGDENYEVTVSNDFYIADIPFEPEDY